MSAHIITDLPGNRERVQQWLRGASIAAYTLIALLALIGAWSLTGGRVEIAKADEVTQVSQPMATVAPGKQ